MDGFYYASGVDYELLETHHEGDFIAPSGSCLAGEVQRHLSRGCTRRRVTL